MQGVSKPLNNLSKLLVEIKRALVLSYVFTKCLPSVNPCILYS